jgi:hypothetical protein
MYEITRRVIKLTVIIIVRYHYQLHTKFYGISSFHGQVHTWMKLLGNHQCGFRHNRSTTDQIFCIRHVVDKKWGYNRAHKLFIDFRSACDSVKREVLYNILVEFGIPMKLVRLIKMCLNET